MFFRILFFAFPLTLWAAALALVIRPLRLRRIRAWTLGGLLLACALKFFWFRVFGGSSFRPEMPLYPLRALGWAYSFGVILNLLALLPPWRRRSRRHVLVLAALAAAIASYGLWEGVRVPSVVTCPVELRGLPPAFDGFRIVHLSDLHASPATDRAHFEGIVQRVNACRPDLVCMTGDFADGTPEARNGQLEPLASIRAKYGMVACSGNHEFYSGYGPWRAALESYGVRCLDNASFTLTNGVAAMTIGGVLDPASLRHGTPPWNRGPNIAAAFADAPAHAYRVLLQHVPILDYAALRRAHVGLVLSGHTHGGAMLGLDLIVKHFNQGHVRGLYAQDGVALYVSPGSGQWAGFPNRLGVPSRITVLELHPAR